ncbi:hypothetical protein NEOLI_005152 [Neolecta irregularis DAH-3]|uniref:Pentatricopeptide repeat-containing protein n=1 Tax=Neolecta irregularis (strain DAH-3) TaxID=1198029 RepID=A0A1U7LGP9_NEOID|nr:hypothetical protein NEOLI_005152 [Neolecta irregularis DAH-3]|eukprot:OLL21701.1 hypothetical protein NEOLI_005152 [Neolecta irregularis DAH-3]
MNVGRIARSLSRHRHPRCCRPVSSKPFLPPAPPGNVYPEHRPRRRPERPTARPAEARRAEAGLSAHKDLQGLGVSDNMIEGAFQPDLFQFRYALSNQNAFAAMELYTSLKGVVSISIPDIKCLLTVIVNHSRKLRLECPDFDAVVRETKPWIQTIQRDIQDGTLSQQALHWVKILDFYKEARAYDEGTQLWNLLHKSLPKIQPGEEPCEYDDFSSEKQSKNVDSRVFGSAIGLLTKAGCPLQHCEALFKEATDKRQLPPSLNLFRGMTTLYAHHSRLPEFFQYFTRAENLRRSSDYIPRSDRFYESAIYQLLEYKHHDAAMTMLERACRTGLETDLVRGEGISAMFREFKKAGLTNYMLRTFRLYMSHGGSSFHTHTTLLLSSILELHVVTPHNELVAVVEEFIAICRKFKVALPISSYNAMIVGFGDMKRPDLVDQVISWMLENNLAPQQNTYRSLLKAFRLMPNTFEKAQEWWATMRKLQKQKQLNIEERDWLMILRAVEKEGEKGWSWVERDAVNELDQTTLFKVTRWIHNLRAGHAHWSSID